MDETAKAESSEIWRKYESVVRRYAMKRLGDRPDSVEEVVSNVSVAFCELYNSGERIEHPVTWFMVTAKNFVNRELDDIHRTRVIKEKLSAIESARLEIPINFENMLITDEMIERGKEDILTLLKPDELLIYNYFYVEDKKHKEIADLMGMSEFAVKQKTHRIKLKIRNYMNDLLDKLP